MVRSSLEIRYDAEADAAYIYVVPRGPARSVARTRFCDVELEGAAISVDLDATNSVLGIEILGASKVLPAALLTEPESG